VLREGRREKATDRERGERKQGGGAIESAIDDTQINREGGVEKERERERGGGRERERERERASERERLSISM